MNLNALSAGYTNSSSINSSANQSTGQSSDSNMFMQLLVAQLKNQDPLSPQEGTEFVAQLAQFNSLDQLMSIRESIDILANNTKSRQVFSNEELKQVN